MPDDNARSIVRTAASRIAQCRQTDWRCPTRADLLDREAMASSAIEGETGDDSIARNVAAIAFLMNRCPTEGNLLTTHRILMQGLDYATPGHYRRVGVTVGAHRPPDAGVAIALMPGLVGVMQNTRLDPVCRIAWAHRQFETIHPFVDGNGRSGRAIITQIAELSPAAQRVDTRPPG